MTTGVMAEKGRVAIEESAGVGMRHAGRGLGAGAPDVADGAPGIVGAAAGQALAAGAPAHVVLVEPDAEVTVDRDASASLSRNNPYAGLTLPGEVVATFLRGRPTVRDRALVEGVTV